MSPLDGANRYETIHVGGTNSRVVCGPLNTVYNAPVINKLQRSDSYELGETRKAILDWLSPLTFQEFHNTIQDTTPIRKANCEPRVRTETSLESGSWRRENSTNGRHENFRTCGITACVSIVMLIRKSSPAILTTSCSWRRQNCSGVGIFIIQVTCIGH